MPLFKKVNIDACSMLETHRRSLRRCRLVFLKDLEVSQLMEFLASDEGFRQEQRDTILACPTREQRVATFLDHLESRGERAFGLFMEALICRSIDWTSVKLHPDFKRPPNDQVPAYIFEKESSSVFPAMLRQTSLDVGDSLTTGHKRRDKMNPGNKYDMHGCIPTASFSSMPPPPVPPKPDNLPLWGLAGCPAVPKPRNASDSLNISPPPRTTSKILLPKGQVKPPVPRSKPCLRLQQSQSAHSALTTLTKPSVIPSVAEQLGEKTGISKSFSLTERNFVEMDSEDEDRVSLNYNVSVASTLEPEDEAEDVTDDRDTTNTEANSSSIETISGSSSCKGHVDINKNRRESSTEEQMLINCREGEEAERQEVPVHEQMPEEQASEMQTLEEPINKERGVHAWEQEQIDKQVDEKLLTEQTCRMLCSLDTGFQGSAEELKEEVQYDLPPADFEDDGSQQIENTLDPPNANDKRVRLPKPSVDQPAFADDEFSSDNSYYEEIEQFFVDCPSPSVQSCSTYLDPYTSSLRKRASNRSSHHFVLEEFRKSGRKFLCRNSLLLVEADSNCLNRKSISDYLNIVGNDDEQQKHDSSDVFKGTTLGFDKEGCAFYVPSHFLKRHGEPEGEPWFYPVSMTSRQASLFLSSMRQEGCFVVYCPDDGVSNVAYNLSVCLANGDVVHYHILENVHGDFGIEGHDHTFMTVGELVEYFRRNKSSLATRLRRPLSCAKQPITPGYHYDIRYELNRSDLSLTGNIIGQGNFGVVCSGLYRNMSVAVKVLQKSDNLTPADEDDFIEEAIAMMELRHDQIVRFVGISCKLRPYFLITEYMQKGNLKDCLRNGVIQADNIDMLLDVCIQVVSAMQYLESLHFMLHRDLAARNFLVNNHLSIKLADFGRARLVSDDYYQAPGTEKICIKWASTEVLIYSHYSTKSDVWALGVVFWEVFSSGARPFSLFSGEQTAMYVTEGGRLDKPSGCPADLYDIMKSCWLDDPDDRPSFHDLAETLKSKSSIYYSKLSNQALNHKRSLADAVKNVSSLPPKQKIASGKSITTPTSAGSNSQKSNVHDKGFKCDMPNENVVRNKSDTRYILNHEGPFTNYLSDLSIATVSSEITDIDQDVSRGDRIRKSLRRLINKKSKTKINELGGKVVHILQDYPSAQ